MSNKITGRFGGALDAALDKVVSTSASSISVADAGTREAFLDGWARTLSDHARYLKSTGASLAAPVVIVYVQDVGLFSEQNDWIKRSMLGSSTKDKFAGILAVASTEVGACVHPDDISDTLEIEANIRLANLQESPTIALVSESKLLIWPGGLDGSLKSFERELDGNAVVVNLDSIDAELNRFYEKVGRQTKKWWKNATSRITVENPESAVQYDLWVFLIAKFSEFARVKMEEVSGNGRTDITIQPSQNNMSNRSAVLELKTVRDVQTPEKTNPKPTKISKNKNIEWACSGIAQTAAYRDHEGFDGAFLCVYDFCADIGKAIDEAIAPNAITHNVIARRYWISASHKEHREDRYSIK